MICYLILSALNQSNCVKLINNLNCHDVKFYIHIDNKFNINSDLVNLASQQDNIHILPNRQVCNWSGYSLVQAMLKLLNEATSTTPEDCTFQFLSDSCIAVKDAKYIKDTLEHRGTNIHFWGKLEKNGGVHLDSKFYRNHWIFDIKYLNHKNYQKTHSKKIVKYLEIGLRFPLLALKKNLPNYIYKGSQWFSLTKSDWVKIQKKIDDSFYDSFKSARAPDEIFFHSAVVYSGLNIKKEIPIQKENIYANHWIDWSDPRSGPKVINSSDIVKIVEQKEALFARKV